MGYKFDIKRLYLCMNECEFSNLKQEVFTKWVLNGYN
jgi:hypothetical protein